MQNSPWIRASILALAGFAISASGSGAVAATAQGSLGGVGSYQGVNFTNRAIVDNTQKRAQTQMNASSPYAKAGWMGARGRLFTSGGSLCKEGSTNYNNGDNTSQINEYSPYNSYCGSGAYYSYGVTYRYNGNGYNAYFTTKSPNLNF